MKRLTFRVITIRLAAVLMLAMTSCAEWDIDTDDDSVGVGSVITEQVVVADASWRKVLSNITGYTFTLNSKGLVDTVRYVGGYACFLYADEFRDPVSAVYDRAEMTLYDHMGKRKVVCSFYIGTNGYAKSATETRMADGKSFDWRFSYDDYGHLTYLKAGGDICTFVYENGNMVEYTNSCANDETYYFSYSSLSSHGYMPYFHAPGYLEEDYGPILSLAYLAGMAGAPSRNLPANCSIEYDDGDSYWTYDYEYKYVFDNYGALVRLYYQEK